MLHTTKNAWLTTLAIIWGVGFVPALANADRPQREANNPMESRVPIRIGANGGSFLLGDKLKESMATGVLHPMSGSESPSATFGQISLINFAGGSTHIDDSGAVVFSNIRLLSEQTDMDDYVELKYVINPSDLSLQYHGASIYGGIGSYYEKENLFANAVTTPLTLQLEGNDPQAENTTWNYWDINGGHRFWMELDATQQPSFFISDLTRDIRFVVYEPGRATPIKDSTLSGDSNWATSFTALKKGMYEIRLGPGDGGDTINFKLTFNNRNRIAAARVEDGSQLYFIKRDRVKEYAVWELDLEKGQTLTVNNSGFTYTEYYLIYEDNSLASTITSNSGSGTFVHPVTKSGTYYYFVVPQTFSSGTYQGSIKIETGISPVSWLQSLRLPPEASGWGDDPNGNGFPNLLEYALGMDPTNPELDTGNAPRIDFQTDGSPVYSFQTPNWVIGVRLEIEKSGSLDFRSSERISPQLLHQNSGTTRFGLNLQSHGSNEFYRLNATLD